jgi:hypothetical protein
MLLISRKEPSSILHKIKTQVLYTPVFLCALVLFGMVLNIFAASETAFAAGGVSLIEFSMRLHDSTMRNINPNDNVTINDVVSEACNPFAVFHFGKNVAWAKGESDEFVESNIEKIYVIDSSGIKQNQLEAYTISDYENRQFVYLRLNGSLDPSEDYSIVIESGIQAQNREDVSELKYVYKFKVFSQSQEDDISNADVVDAKDPPNDNDLITENSMLEASNELTQLNDLTAHSQSAYDYEYISSGLLAATSSTDEGDSEDSTTANAGSNLSSATINAQQLVSLGSVYSMSSSLAGEGDVQDDSADATEDITLTGIPWMWLFWRVLIVGAFVAAVVLGIVRYLRQRGAVGATPSRLII